MTQREPVFNVPTVVTVIAGLFVLIHVIRALLPPETDLWLLIILSFIPARYGGSDIAVPGGDLSAVTSFVTYMFVHGDLMHLTVNSIWLLVFGSAIAKRVGTLRFLGFSALCGIGGILTHLAFHWGELSPVVGASAAISGQMAGAMRFFFGAYKNGRFNDIRINPKSVPLIGITEALREPRILMFLAIWLALNVLFGLGAVDIGESAAIAWEAHIGGFLTGLLLFQRFDRGNPVNPGFT